MRTRLTAAAAVALLVAGACAPDSPAPDGQEGPPRVVATLKPLAELVAAVGGDAVSVTTLARPGVEPHDLELDADAIDALEAADRVVHVGGGFQPAVDEIVERLDRDRVLDMAAVLELDGDPHFWLDPGLYAQAAAAIAGWIDAGAGAREVIGQIEALRAEFEAGLRNCETRVLVTAHDAFGHLATAFDLQTEAIAGLSPEAEPDPRRLARLAQVVKATGTTTIFTEELVSPAVAETLARETGASTAVLDPLEASDASYTEGMRANLEALRKGLRCT